MKNKYSRTVFCCGFGAMIQACVVNFAPILFIVFSNIYDLSYEKIGRLVLFNFVTQLTVDFIAAKLAHRLELRRTILTAHGLIAVGFILMAVLPGIIPPYIALCLSVTIYAIGGGLLEVFLSPITDAIPAESKSGAMTMMHSFYSWGQVIVVIITTLLLTLTGEKYWQLISIFWAIFPIVNFILLTRAPIPPAESGKMGGVTKLFKSKSFLVALLIMLCAGSSELTMSQWASMFAERGLGVSKVMGDILGPCLFAVFMGSGRLLHGMFGHRYNMNKLLAASGILCVICYITAVFAPNPLLSLAGCAVCGLSVSLMWPGTLSVTAQKIPTGGVALFAIMAMFGDIGCSVGPWLSGIVSDIAVKTVTEQQALKLGILAGIIFPITLAAITIAQCVKEKNKAK